MKFLLMFTFVAIAVASIPIEPDQEGTLIAKYFAMAFNISVSDSQECIDKTGVHEEDLKYLSETLDMENREITDRESLSKASCALVCCAQKQGTIVNGEVQLDKALDAWIEEVPQEVESIVRDSASICKKQAPPQTNDCLYFYFFTKCTILRTRSLLREIEV